MCDPFRLSNIRGNIKIESRKPHQNECASLSCIQIAFIISIRSIHNNHFLEEELVFPCIHEIDNRERVCGQKELRALFWSQIKRKGAVYYNHSCFKWGCLE